ncbi:MAG: oligosaccharide flippase family protein [Acidobacteriota bacterium]
MEQPTSTLRSAALIAASTYVTTALGFIVSIIVARSLGPHDYGQYAYLVWLSGFLVTIGNHGLSISGIRFISECLGRGELDEARNVHRWLRNQQLLSVAGVLLIFAITTHFFKPAGWMESTLLLLGVVGVSVVGKAFYIFNISIAKGYRKFSVESWSNMIMSVVYTLGAAILAYCHASLPTFAIFFGAISAAHMGIVAYFFKKESIQAGQGVVSTDLLGRLKPHLWWTIILVIVVTLSNKTLETLLLSALTGPSEVGYFAIATALTRGGVDLLSSTLTTMLMPMMGHAYGEGGIRKVNAILSNSLRYFTFLGLLLAGVGVLWSELGILLMYGAKYIPVIDVLRVMMLVGGLTLTEGAFGSLLSTTDNQKLRAQISILSVIVSAVASLSLVPLYGLSGAVISHAVTRISIVLLMGWKISAEMDVSLPLKDLGRLFGAAAISIGLITPLLWLNHSAAMQFACGIVFAMSFIPATFLLNAWTDEDLGHLTPLIKRLPMPIRAWLDKP